METAFYHVYISPKRGITRDDVETKMNLALDWFRYDSKNWIVYTNADATKLIARLKPLVEPDGELFVCKLDVGQRGGWMPNKFWQWIREHDR